MANGLEEKIGEIALRVSRYFSDFLESDFKKGKAPSRRIVLTTDSGFRSAMRVGPYPSLDDDLWALLGRPSGDDLSLTIEPRKYIRPISVSLGKVIREQVLAIPRASIDATRQAVRDKVIVTQGNAINNPEEWIDSIREELAKQVGVHIVQPLIDHLDGPMRQQAYAVMDSLASAKFDLVSRVSGDLDKVLPDVLAKFVATHAEAPLDDALQNFLTLEDTQEGLLAIFDNFVASDGYLEFRDLETYVSNAEGMQLYLYIGALRYAGNQYPVFFIPVEIELDSNGSGYKLTLINHLFTNRSAIDFVLEKLAEEMQRPWVSPIKERITYLQPSQSVFEVASILFRLVVNSLDLGGQIQLSQKAQDAKTSQIVLSPSLTLAAHDRADDALLNDYEEIINQAKTGGSAIVDLFEGIVKQMLGGNSDSIRVAVEEEWDKLPLVDRVLDDSPIPLNEEQRKVVIATRKSEGKIIVVEGPPGTGKSHTITAIAADCAFAGRSCLILSDKTEALDVVQEKLSDAMNKVRHDQDFPNPILRLGQQNANFKKLTSTQAVTQVAAYAKATKAAKPRIEAERKETQTKLREAIDKTVEVLGAVQMKAVQDLHHVETELHDKAPGLLALLEESVTHAVPAPSLVADLSQCAQDVEAITAYLDSLKNPFIDGAKLLERVRIDTCIDKFVQGRSLEPWNCFESLTYEQSKELGQMLVVFAHLKMPIFGYLFKGSQVRALELRVNQLSVRRPIFLKQDAANLATVVSGCSQLRDALEQIHAAPAFGDTFKMLASGRKPERICHLAERLLQGLARINPKLPDAILVESEILGIGLAIEFLQRWSQTATAFRAAPEYDYVGSKTMLERVNTSVLNAQVDGRLVDFMDKHKADAKALAAVIADRLKFPEDKFGNIRDSFPVILASIREFGEFMPLAPDLFDVVIIDEGSQVSVAQALPALLRGTKIVVFGDTKQFSNVKSANASIAQNEKYRADLTSYFMENVTTQADALKRLANFDVKRSILEFCSSASSYTTMLTKHFRSYPELIGYSSTTFYGGQLQALKIRGRPIDEVIRFDEITIEPGKKVTRGINEPEGEFILERLIEMLEEEDELPTVGIITPFREQQTYLTKMIFSHARGRDFEDKLRLRIFTFDSCQGNERNIVFYSMVATPGNDALNYIFPVELTDAQTSVEDKLKVQRLNVGFSRAQEMVWFVHSMPLDSYRGSIGRAMTHYANTLERPHAEASQTDASSPMEAKVLHWLYQTPFCQNNEDQIEVLPQFPIGDYLKQLDPTYSHPAWRVDFLLTFQAEKGPIMIVIEYDGFEYHFQKGKTVHVGNHEHYLEPSDLERQLTLESYGYRFLRINRFNLGKDPVQTLNERLKRLVEMATGQPISSAVSHMQSQAAGLATRDMRECSRCKQIREAKEFFDPKLKEGKGGLGRVCMVCKASDAARASKPRAIGGSGRRWKY